MINLILRIRELRESIPIESLRNILCQNFYLNKHERKFIVRNSEKAYIKLSFLDEEERDKVINILLKMKIKGEKITAGKQKIDVIKIEKEQFYIDIKLANIWEITFEKATFLKIGSVFKTEIDVEIFFIWLMRRYNNIYATKEKLEKSELQKIKKIEGNFEKELLKVQDFSIEGFKGKLKIDISEVNTETKEQLEKLLNFVLYSGYGYKNEIGYGEVSIKYQEEVYE